jgi:uncharacterized cupredoxin-like copper-binding protein
MPSDSCVAGPGKTGDSTLACKLAGHDEAGMKGTLTVTGS